MKGLAFALPFWRWWKIRRKGGRRRGAKRPKKRGARGPLASGPALFVWQAEGRPWGPPLGRQTPPPPRVAAPAFLLPMSNRRWADGGMLTRGRREALGCAPAGRRRFEGPKGPQNQSMGGGQGPPPMLCARCARPPPRPGRWDFPPAKRSIRHPFSPWLPANKTSGPLPMSGPPAYFVRNQKSLPANFPPLFSKAAGGRSPQRDPGRSPGARSRILTH